MTEFQSNEEESKKPTELGVILDAPERENFTEEQFILKNHLKTTRDDYVSGD